jgi:hypothetical protein
MKSVVLKSATDFLKVSAPKNLVIFASLEKEAMEGLLELNF